MESVLLLDTSIATDNNGDKIIMECVEEELSFITKNRFIYSLPTHVSSFHWYQVLRNSYAIQRYANCEFKFAVSVKTTVLLFWEGIFLQKSGVSFHIVTQPVLIAFSPKLSTYSLLRSSRTL